MTKKKIIEQITYWKKVFKPSGNMGKWSASIRVEKWQKKLAERIKKSVAKSK